MIINRRFVFYSSLDFMSQVNSLIQNYTPDFGTLNIPSSYYLRFFNPTITSQGKCSILKEAASGTGWQWEFPHSLFLPLASVHVHFKYQKAGPENSGAWSSALNISQRKSPFLWTGLSGLRREPVLNLGQASAVPR